MDHGPKIRLVVGDRWKSEAARLLQADSAVILGRDFDLAELRAPIDLVLDAANVTSRLPDEPVIPFVSQLATAVCAFVSGTSSAAVVEFEEAPWELALQRAGPDLVLLSLYEVAPPGRFAIELRPISLDRLRAAVDKAVATMAKAVDELPAVAGRAAVQAAISACRDPGGEAASVWAPVPGTPTDLTIETLSSERLTLVTHLRVGGQPLLAYGGDAALDRLALLAPGTLMIAPDAGRAVRLEGRPLMALEEASERFREVLRRWSDDASEHRLVTTREGDLVCRTDGTTAVLLHRCGGVVDWSIDLDAETFFALLLDHVRDVAAACVDANPQLAANGHLGELRRTAELMRRRLIRVTRKPESRRRAARADAAADQDDPTSGRFDPFRFPAQSIRRMRYERMWTHVVPGVTPRTLRFAGHAQWLVGHDRGVELVDAADGRSLWHHTHGARGLVWDVAESTAIFIDERGGAIARDMESGGVSWATRLGAPAEPLTPLARVGAGRVVIALADGNLVAIEAATGALHWRVGVGADGAASLAAAGGVVVAATLGGDLTAVDAETGTVVWGQRLPYERVRLASTGASIVILADNPLEHAALVGSVDPVTGRWRDGVRLDADVVAFDAARGLVAAVVAEALDHRVMIWSSAGDLVHAEAGIGSHAPVRGAGCVVDVDGVVTLVGGRMCGFREAGMAWALRLGPVMGEVRLAGRNGAPGIVAVAAEDEVAVVEVAHGRVLHRLPAFWEQLAWLGLDERGHLLALEHPGGRAPRLHGVAAVGIIAALDGGSLS